MNFKKLILPMLAFICAIGVAFATVDLKPEPKMVMDDSYATMYVYTDGWHTIEVDCGTGELDCEVIFSDDLSSTPYQVYNSPDFNDRAKGNGQRKQIPGSPPSN